MTLDASCGRWWRMISYEKYYENLILYLLKMQMSIKVELKLNYVHFLLLTHKWKKVTNIVRNYTNIFKLFEHMKKIQSLIWTNFGIIQINNKWVFLFTNFGKENPQSKQRTNQIALNFPLFSLPQFPIILNISALQLWSPTMASSTCTSTSDERIPAPAKTPP